MPTSRPRGKHRRPSSHAPTLAAGVTAAVLFGDLIAPTTASAAASASDLARLRQCEASGNYRANTGNGYYGAYQFDARTWRGLGLSGLPHQASPATQDEAARRLQSQRGWSPWPGCSRKLGLGRSGSAASRDRVAAPTTKAPTTKEGGKHRTKARATAPAAKHRRTAAPTVVTPAIELLPVGTVLMPPPYPVVDLTPGLGTQVREDVRTWQLQMAKRGWDLVVDGRFGAESAAIAAAFRLDKGITRDDVAPGVVDWQLWNATWQAPVVR